jgi:hypothetical protein
MRLSSRAQCAVSLLISLSIVACAGLPRRQAVTDSRTVYVWPLDACPSQPAGDSKSLVGAGSVLLGNVLSGLIGTQAAALSAAADADRGGFTATGVNARFYYGTTQAGGTTVTTPPACYVMALARPASRAQTWCDDAAFRRALPATCVNGVARLEGLKARESLAGETETDSGSLSVPDFYAEIRLDPAGHGAAVRPALAALYYPYSLLQPGSQRARTLSLTIESASLQKSDPLRAADVAITVAGVIPSAQQPGEVLVRAQTGWTGVPSFTPQSGDPAPRPNRRYLPVTMQASIHEVGEPNAFLSAFAKAFAASNGDYAEALAPR